jgi:hypothetical protein
MRRVGADHDHEARRPLMVTGTVLVVVTTNAADMAAMESWLVPQLAAADVALAQGFYAGVSAIERRVRAVVIDVGLPDGRDDWRLAELRARRNEAAFVVVADAVHLPMLAGALHADLAVTKVGALPPLRELLVTDEPLVRDQATWRRTSR